LAALSLGFETALPGRSCGTSPAPWRGFARCLLNQGDQPIQGVLAIPLLGAEAARIDDQNAILRCTVPRQAEQSLSNVIGQSRRVGGVEAQLHGCCRLVDILSPRSRAMDEGFLDLCFVYGDGLGYLNHAFHLVP